MFSGAMTLTKHAGTAPHLKGRVVLERAQLKENLFSGKLQKDVFAYTGMMFADNTQDVTCDVTVESKDPIAVDTAFFRAQAKLFVHVGNSIRDPKVSGSVELQSGELLFPYKSLSITKGAIYFLPDRLHDPLLELVATNNIKKYDVGLHVTGSLQNHHISLDASPALSEEEIISLLLVGTPSQSFNAVISTLVMQNLKSLIFDSEQSPLRVASIFNSWLKPLRNVTFAPNITDQGGRGGLRGGIDIEMNERWRAQVQRNFSLTEDTRLNLEYLLALEYMFSDGVSVRGVHDERRDVGAEVEMRWKFGG
jgi:hypothetical protein